MTSHTAVCSISDRDTRDDVHVRVTFMPRDPIDRTKVVVDPDPARDSTLLSLIDAAIDRLIAYRDAFIEAEDADTEAAVPRSLPVPWHAWGR